MWSFVKGGWSPLQALQAATVNPARTLGLSKDIGSLEAGKLADLVVLDANPLANIRNSDKVSKVMIGGRLYDSMTLNEQLTGTRARPSTAWTRTGTSLTADSDPALPASLAGPSMPNSSSVSAERSCLRRLINETLKRDLSKRGIIHANKRFTPCMREPSQPR